MDVRCARCGIEYEFDDALISERGTMVRCTECGHQFRVHPSHVIPAEPDEWRVVVASGRTLVFRTLRELQQGISHGEVGRDATLLRGHQPPRPLGSIAELDPFFPTRAGPARQQSTLTGVAPPAAALPPGPRPSPTTGKVPIARVGLSAIQVPVTSAITEDTEAYRVGQGRTALGLGAPVIAAQPEPAEELAIAITDSAATNTIQSAAAPSLPVGPVDAESAPLRRPGTSDTPTLRQGETPKGETPTEKISVRPAKAADKIPTIPPRPTRRTRPTPAAGTNAATSVSAAAPAESATPVAPEKPIEESPPAQRATSEDTQLATSSPIALETTEPMASDAGPPSPQLPVTDSEEVEAPFIPTIPPMRATYSQGLRQSKVAPPQSSRFGRWLIVFLLGVLVSLGVLWSHFRRDQARQMASSQSALDLDRHLQGAREALRTGDLALAHENLQSSQAPGAHDARWATLTARYDIMRADMNWLAVRLADPSDTSRLESLQRELSENVSQSNKALGEVERVVTDTDLVAARLDAQRISGETEKARQASVTLEGSNLSPDLAYALAGVELVQPKPRFKEIFEWLGQARAIDSGLGRAPVMLVLACVAGNRMENAQAEIQRLKLSSRSHPLLAEVEAFVKRAADNAVATHPGNLVDGGIAAVARAAEAEALAEVTREGDFRIRLRRAAEALGRNELTRAEQLFRSVLAEHPKDTEALAGLGDVARRHGNVANAISYYERVLAGNGQYLPALSALADIKWKSGDRAGAAALYRRILDQVGESPGYGQTAVQRLRELSDSAGSKANTPSESDKTASPVAAPRTAASNIDRTDLRGKAP